MVGIIEGKVWEKVIKVGLIAFVYTFVHVREHTSSREICKSFLPIHASVILFINRVSSDKLIQISSCQIESDTSRESLMMKAEMGNGGTH